MAPAEKKKPAKAQAQSRSALKGAGAGTSDAVTKAEDVASTKADAATAQEAASSLPEEAPTADDSLLLSFADELGVEGLSDVLHGHKGRIFSAAGRESPVAEFATNGVVLRPAQKPYSDDEPGEVIIFGVDPRGVLLNELGQPRKIVGAKFKGQPIFTLAEIKPGTVKHYAAWFDKDNKPHKLYVQGQALTSDMIFRIRNRTLDGEIGIFSEITTD